MKIKIENYIIELDSVRSISLWLHDNGEYVTFEDDKTVDRDDDEMYFCLTVDYTNKASEDDFDTITLENILVGRDAKCYFERLNKRIQNPELSDEDVKTIMPMSAQEILNSENKLTSWSETFGKNNN